MVEEAGLDVGGAGEVGDGCAYLLVREIVRVTGPLGTGSDTTAGVGCADASVARQRRTGAAAEKSEGHASGRAIQLRRRSDMAADVNSRELTFTKFFRKSMNL